MLGWKQPDTYTVHQAVIDACYLWQSAKFEETLCQNLHWRKARNLIQREDLFEGRWTSRVSGRAMRLTRYGLEIRFTHGIHRESWKDLQDRVQWWRD